MILLFNYFKKINLLSTAAEKAIAEISKIVVVKKTLIYNLLVILAKQFTLSIKALLVFIILKTEQILQSALRLKTISLQE